MPLEQFKKLTLEEMLVEIRSWPEPPPDPDEVALSMHRAARLSSSTVSAPAPPGGRLRD